MDDRILVTYASKAGSTEEVAVIIGEVLTKKNHQVDVLPVASVTDLSPYRMVIVGSAIRAGRILPEAFSFIDKNQTGLREKQVSVFVVCLTMKDDNEENRRVVSAYLDPLRALVTPTSEGLFAGVLDSQKLGFVERLIMKAMKAPQGDYRQLQQIIAWAESLILQK